MFGVFDLLHPGHLYFLREAKKYGDHLTVVITRDARVLHEKGHTPKLNERERVEMVSALRDVDNVALGDKVGEWKILRKLKPNVICIGYDQDATLIECAGLTYRPKIVRITQYKKYSSRVITAH